MATMNSRISRGGFIRRAVLGAAAIAGASRASDYFPPPDTVPSPDIVPRPGQIIVFPSGNAEQDLQNLQGAISQYSQPVIRLMGRTRSGTASGFALPPDGTIFITRDVEISGGEIIGGYIAFYCRWGFSLSLKNIVLRGQSAASVAGYFSNLGLVSSGVEPIPVPSPASCGFVVRLSGTLSAVNSYAANTRVGLFAQGMQSGHVASCEFDGSECAAFLMGDNTTLSGNRLSGAQPIANAIVSGQSNTLFGNRFFGSPLANLLILPGASMIRANFGIGSVASGVEPIPVPEPKIIDMGAGSVLNGRYSGISPPEGLLAQVEEVLGSLQPFFYPGEGNPDVI